MMIRSAAFAAATAALLRAAAAALLLSACSAEPDPPGGLSADETSQLNQAAAMLDANSVDAGAVGANASDNP